MFFFNPGSFFRLLCDWLENVQCCLLRIYLMLFFLSKLDTPSTTARQLYGCLQQYLYQVDPPQTLRHLCIPPDILQGVEMLAWRWGSRPDLQIWLQLQRKKGQALSFTYLTLFTKVIKQYCILKMHMTKIILGIFWFNLTWYVLPNRCFPRNLGALNYGDNLFVYYQSVLNLPRWAADVTVLNSHQRNVKIKSPSEMFLVQPNLI